MSKILSEEDLMEEPVDYEDGEDEEENLADRLTEGQLEELDKIGVALVKNNFEWTQDLENRFEVLEEELEGTMDDTTLHSVMQDRHKYDKRLSSEAIEKREQIKERAANVFRNVDQGLNLNSPEAANILNEYRNLDGYDIEFSEKEIKNNEQLQSAVDWTSNVEKNEWGEYKITNASSVITLKEMKQQVQKQGDITKSTTTSFNSNSSRLDLMKSDNIQLKQAAVNAGTNALTVQKVKLKSPEAAYILERNQRVSGLDINISKEQLNDSKQLQSAVAWTKNVERTADGGAKITSASKVKTLTEMKQSVQNNRAKTFAPAQKEPELEM